MTIREILTRDSFSKFLGQKVEKYSVESFPPRVVAETRGSVYVAEDDISDSAVFTLYKFQSALEYTSGATPVSTSSHNKKKVLISVDILPDRNILSEIYGLKVLGVEYLQQDGRSASFGLFPAESLENVLSIKFKNGISITLPAERIAEKIGIWVAQQGMSIIVAFGDPIHIAKLFDKNGNPTREFISKKVSNAVFMAAKYAIKVKNKESSVLSVGDILSKIAQKQ